MITLLTEDKKFSLRDYDEAIEMFDLSAAKVFKNILDPNTPNSQAREVTLKVKFVPDPDSGMTTMEVAAGSKLAPQRTHRSKVIIGFEGGRYIGRRIKKQKQQLLPGQVVTIGDTQNE